VVSEVVKKGRPRPTRRRLLDGAAAPLSEPRPGVRSPRVGGEASGRARLGRGPARRRPQRRRRIGNGRVPHRPWARHLHPAAPDHRLLAPRPGHRSRRRTRPHPTSADLAMVGLPGLATDLAVLLPALVITARATPTPRHRPHPESPWSTAWSKDRARPSAPPSTWWPNNSAQPPPARC